MNRIVQSALVLVLGVASISACALDPLIPSMSITESATVVTRSDGGAKKISVATSNVVLNGRKVYRFPNGWCVAESTLLVNVLRKTVHDVNLVLPKVQVTRTPVVCPAKRSLDMLEDGIVQMQIEETWYVDQVRNSVENGDAVVSISVIPLITGTSIKYGDKECIEETSTLENVRARRIDDADLIVPGTRTESSTIPCPAPADARP